MTDKIKAFRTWLTQSDPGIALLLFLLTSWVYFATITGVTSSNDGGHHALVRAIVERGSFEISPYLAFTENQDYAFNGDRRFSHNPPGTALMAAPIYALSYISPLPTHRLPSKHDPDNPRMVYAVATAALAAGGAIALFFLTLRRHFELSRTAALLAGLGLAFGTTMWKYGSVLFSHAPSAMALWLALYLILEIEKKDRLDLPQAILLGLALGIAPLIEYTNVLWIGIAGIYLALMLARPFFRAMASPKERNAWMTGLIGLVAGAAIPLGFLLIYNTLNFGGPLELSGHHVDPARWPQAMTLQSQFSTPLTVGLPAMLFYDGNNQGLFLLSPITLLGIAGLWPLYHYSRRRFILLLGSFAVFVIVFSAYWAFNPMTNDTRYLTPFLGLWFVPVGFWIDRHYAEKSTSTLPTLMLSLLLYGLLFLSIRNQFMHIAFSWNYDLSLSSLRPMATPLDNIAILLGTVFRNTANLPLLWLIEGSGLLIGLGIVVLKSRIKA
ncbi:MAG: hypothetical protein JXB07_22285 [Anaerolineae bacterium]|nr:hypothetical protein [Anaerolineae bacterium]